MFFKGHGPHLERAHPPGAVRLVSGKVERDRFAGTLQMAHPDYMLPPERAGDIPEVEAVYPATAGLPSRAVRRFAAEALARAPTLAEWGDPAFVDRERWPSWREALGRAARARQRDRSRSRARRTVAGWRSTNSWPTSWPWPSASRPIAPSRPADRRQRPGGDAPEAALPFRLTGAQDRVLAEIRADLTSAASV